MKALLIFFFMAIQAPVVAQTDTIGVSKNYKTVLIFPEEIAESIMGDDLKFMVNLPDPEGSIYSRRILKLFYNDIARDRGDVFTNFTVITQSGLAYDFILKRVEKPKQLTLYINNEQATTSIVSKNTTADTSDVTTTKTAASSTYDETEVDLKPLEKGQTLQSIATPELYRRNPEEYYRLMCYYTDLDKSIISRYFSRNENLYLWLKGIYYNNDELYFHFALENKEGLDYDVNFISYSIATNYKKSSSNQKVVVEPLYVYKRPGRVKGGETRYFIAVFRKFSLDKNKDFIIDVDEDKGSRTVTLNIPNDIVNNPKRF